MLYTGVNGRDLNADRQCFFSCRVFGAKETKIGLKSFLLRVDAQHLYAAPALTIMYFFLFRAVHHYASASFSGARRWTLIVRPHKYTNQLLTNASKVCCSAHNP